MAVGFVVNKFHKDGTSEYFQGKSQFGDMFSRNIRLAWIFETYEEAEVKINSLEGLFQIEKIFYN